MNIDKIIALYVRKRDEIDALESAHKASISSLKGEMQLIEGALQKLMDEQGVRQFKGEHGTAFKKEWTASKVTAWEDTLAYIQENERWDLLNRAVNKTVAVEIGNVPGVTIERGFKVEIRRRS